MTHARDDADAQLVRREEELSVGRVDAPAGTLRARKTVETEHVSEVVPRRVEEAAVERTPAADGDSGEIETLPDGSISIPILEEELVVTKRIVVRERVIVRKVATTERQRIETELRKERLDLDAEDGAEVEPEVDPQPR